MMRLFGRFRKETAKQDWDSALTDRTKSSDYVTSLVSGRIENKDELDHLWKVARGDPIASYITFSFADNLFDDWFKFVDKDGNEIMLDVQKELKRLEAKKIFTLATAASRTFGWCWLYLSKNKNYTEVVGNEQPLIAELDFFNPLEATVDLKDEWNRPTRIKIKVAPSKFKKLGIPNDENGYVILWRTAPIDRSYKGESALYSIWDNLVSIRNLKQAMLDFDQKIGKGLFTVELAQSPPSGFEAFIETEIQDMGTRKAVALDPDKIKEIKFVGSSTGATDFDTHIRLCLEQISVGAGIPKIILTGDNAGSIVGSEINVKALYANTRKEQVKLENLIRNVVTLLGFQYEDYDFHWNVAFAYDDEQRARIMYLDAQTNNQKLKYMTINEIRADAGLSPIDDGDVLADDKKQSLDINAFSNLNEEEEESLQTPEEMDQTRNEEGLQL